MSVMTTLCMSVLALASTCHLKKTVVHAWMGLCVSVDYIPCLVVPFWINTEMQFYVLIVFHHIIRLPNMAILYFTIAMIIMGEFINY